MLVKQRRPVAKTASIPAPTGGWNKRDNIADMSETDAVICKNYFPTASDVMLRLGAIDWVTGFTGDTVETLMGYQSATASKLFAVVDVGATAEIVDVTNTDTDGTPPASAVTALTNARCQHVNFSNSGGAFLLAVNGADKMRYYTGSAWDVDGGGTYAVTGVDTATWIHLNIHKRRVWAVQKDTLLAWYLPTDAIAGGATSFDFRPIFKRGGYLMAMGTWSLDAGEGLDDHAVFVTSEGEVAVYKGTDPASATTWALVGVWHLGNPIGRRCLVKFGGDLLIVSQDGLLPFSSALMSSRVNTKSALTDKIQQAVSEATSIYGSNFGWQIMPYPVENMLMLNVPTSATASHQYVMNTITGAWCWFEGWNATCWELFDDEIYYGTAGKVCKAWEGNSDFNANIEGEVLPAFSAFGNRGNIKHFKMAKPIISTDGNPGVLLGINTDYDITAPTGTPTFTATAAATWDSAVWDASVWGGSYSIKKDWQTIGGIGNVAALHLVTASQGVNIRWASTVYVYEVGGVLG